MASPSAQSSEGSKPIPEFKLLTESSLKEYLEDAKDRFVPLPRKELREGCVLPIEYNEKFDGKTMACVPLEEIDPAYRNLKTFVVIGKKGTIHRYTARNTLATLSPLNPIRKLSLYVTTHWLYSIFMVAVVLTNVVALTYNKNKFIDYTCILIYALEFALKLFCEGLIRDPFSYLRKSWNLVDLAVIFGSAIKPLKGMPLLCWLRALKVIHVVPEIRRSFRFVVKSIAKLKTSLLLTSLIIFMFAILGKELFSGSLTRRCILRPSEEVLDNMDNFEIELPELMELEINNGSMELDKEDNEISHLTPWELHATNESNWFSNELCIPGWNGQCPNGYDCTTGFGSNPDYGYMNFDTFGSSLIQTVRIIDQDYLEKALNQLTHGNGPTITIVYFIFAFFFGTYALGTFAYALISTYVFGKLDAKAKNECLIKFENDECEEESEVEIPISTIGVDQHRIMAKKLIKNELFEAFITLTILIDIFGMVLSHYQMSNTVTQFTRSILLLVLIIYVGEFILKMYALGLTGYIQNGWNILDIVILLDVILWTLRPEYYVPYPFRMFKITPRWNTLNITFKIIGNSFKLLWGFLGLLITIWAYYGLVGKSEFGEDYFDNMDKFENQELPRWSFVDFFHSAMVVFRSWIGESIEVLGDCLLVSDSDCLFFLSVVSLSGGLILMIMTAGVVFVTDRTLKSYPKFSQKPSILAKIFCYPYIWIKNKAGCSPSNPNENIDVDDDGQKRIIMASPPMGGSKVLRGVSTVIIFVASLVLMLDNVPNQSNFDIQSVIYAVDVVFTIFFTIMAIYSLVICGGKYCVTSPGWIFDVLVILEMILNVLYDTRRNPHPYPMFYLLRSLRPFMLVSRIECLEVVLKAILAELRFLWKFMIVGLFIWLSFGVMGTEMFSGAFNKCIDDEDGSLINATVISTKSECLANNYTWENSDLNFDHIGKSFVSLALVGKRNSWISILHDTFDFHSPLMNFRREYDLNNFYFFLAFFVCGIFFVVSLIFGVMYHYLQKFSGMFLTTEQRKGLESIKNYTYDIRQPMYANPEGKYRSKIYFFVTSYKFDICVMIIIIVDNIFLACSSFNSSQSVSFTLQLATTAILFLYIMELLLKIIGWGRNYFQTCWNQMDFFIVMACTITLVSIELGYNSINFDILRVFRLLRIFQFQPFISRARIIKLYIQAFYKISTRLKNILIFHLFIMYSYSLLGISKFGNVRLWKGLDSFFNFHTVSSSMRVLFMLSSMAGVDGVLPVLTEEYNCTPNEMGDDNEIKYGDCGNMFWGTLFVFSYSFFSFLNFMNLYFLFIFQINQEIKISNAAIVAKAKIMADQEQCDNVDDPDPDIDSCDLKRTVYKDIENPLIASDKPGSSDDNKILTN